MAQLSLNNITFSYSHPPLLDGVTLHINRGERIGLVGRNGAGKSTLLKIIAGRLAPDDGTIGLDQDVIVAELTQEIPQGQSLSAFEVAAEGFGPAGAAVSEFRRLGQLMQDGTDLTSEQQAAYDRASQQLADSELWTAGDQLDGLLQEMQLPPDAVFSDLSAGMKRRVLLAKAMIQQPDILLLDEPTNHLDIESILWLQNYLQRFEGTLIFVTHDREFLQDLANRIIEVDRGRLFDWTCDYQTFLRRRDELLAAEAIEEKHFDRKLAEEERWIRQGIKARRTRNEGRVRALKKMREERKQRRQKVGTARLQIQESEKSGRLVVKIEHVTHKFGSSPPLIRDFSTTIMRGDRVGIIGPNGIGKSTLLKILLGELQPSDGSVTLGTNLSIAYFDQLRDQLDPNKSARENVAEGNDFLEINGQRRHVMGYLQDFLFAPDRAQTRVEYLSGGERNRLLMAKLLAKPANLLVLDEPTNDLDVETLELLEETLPQFNGTILLVSHDRAFLNNVVTSTIAFEGDGVVREVDGGYDDYLRERLAREAETAGSGPGNLQKTATAPPQTAAPAPAKTATKARKLSYKEQRELESLPTRIDELETRQSELHQQMASPDFFKRPGDEIATARKELETIETELAVCFSRWEELEDA